MKPQDVIVLLKLILWRDKAWTQRQLADSLSLNLAEVNHSLKRLAALKLYYPADGFVMRKTLLDFLISGLPLAFPGKLGKVQSGVATAHAALAQNILFDDSELYVWPNKHGKEKGRSLLPLHKCAPEASERDPKLYQLLALIDVLRVGQAREKNVAKIKLKIALDAR